MFIYNIRGQGLETLPYIETGGEIIRPFAFTMLVGVIIGTYSSIYIASGLLASLYKSSN